MALWLDFTGKSMAKNMLSSHPVPAHVDVANGGPCMCKQTLTLAPKGEVEVIHSAPTGITRKVTPGGMRITAVPCVAILHSMEEAMHTAVPVTSLWRHGQHPSPSLQP